jgi:hypothetical protein
MSVKNIYCDITVVIVRLGPWGAIQQLNKRPRIFLPSFVLVTGIEPRISGETTFERHNTIGSSRAAIEGEVLIKPRFV